MSAPTAPETQEQTSQTPHEAAQLPMPVMQPEPRSENHGEAQEPLQAEGNIVIDQAFDDSTSAYSDELSTYTASLTSSVLNYPTENGRRYHAFREGTYYFPNDEEEQDRMDIHHEMAVKAAHGKLHLAPLTNPGRILDIGTGTGIWSIEMGDMFPDSEIIGNDFSPVQPNMVPRNVKFEVDDVEAPWTHQEKFDYIHCRFMAGSITDWPKLVRTCYDNLHPGAIAEFQDGDFRIYSEDGSYKGSWFEKWNRDFEKAGELVGRSIRPGPCFKDWMTEVGFEDIHEEKTRIPVGVWAKDKHMKEIGAFNLVQMREGLEGFSMALFTRNLGWSAEEVQVLLSKTRIDMGDRNIHAQNDFFYVWGRKPIA